MESSPGLETSGRPSQKLEVFAETDGKDFTDHTDDHIVGDEKVAD